MGFVIIPFDYEQLPDEQQKAITPICIASVDRHGNEIARVWFDEGVVPIQDQLRGIARFRLGDVYRVSELAELTVHKLWEHHGSNAGFLPWRRVLVRALWESRRLAAGGSDWRIRHIVPLALRGLDLGLYGSNLSDPEESYAQSLLLGLVERRIEEHHREDIRDIFLMLRQGYRWDEIAERLGAPNQARLKKRFRRWIRDNFQQDSPPRMPPGTHTPRSSHSRKGRMP